MIVEQAGRPIGTDGETAFLSNFYMGVPVEHKGIVYPSAEHAFQAAKCARDSDRRLFLSCKKPGEAKRLGRRVQLREDWENVKLAVMEDVLRSKFKLPELCSRLLATGTCNIIHANTWHDQFWGDCLCPMHRAPGENHLGRILIKLRAEMNNENNHRPNPIYQQRA